MWYISVADLLYVATASWYCFMPALLTSAVQFSLSSSGRPIITVNLMRMTSALVIPSTSELMVVSAP